MRSKLYISGYVQGVGYRQFVKSNAIRLGLTGWVKNESDGSVRAEVEGDRGKIERLIELCRKGVFPAEVKAVDVTWIDAGEVYDKFEIRHD